MREHLPVFPVIVPLMASFLLAFFRDGRWAWHVAMAVAGVLPFIAFAIFSQVLNEGVLSYHIGGWPPPIGIEYRIDRFNGFMLILVSLVNLVVLPYARLNVAAEVRPGLHGWFYVMYMLCLAGSLGIVVTGDAFNAFVFLEISAISSYTLIAMGRDSRGLVAAYQYLIIGTLGASFYVIAVAFLYNATGTLNLVDMGARLASIDSVYPIFAASAFLVTGLGIKFALFPLHSWLPNAYAYAPCTVSSFLSGTATKVFIYLMLRFIYGVLGMHPEFGLPAFMKVFLLLGASAMVLCSVAAILQDNVKRMLAYSSLAQMGYVMLGVGMMNESGLAGSIVHLFNHALAKVCLFLVVGAVVYRILDAHMENFSGLGHRMPWTFSAFIVAGLSLAGVPGTAGFISKWYLVEAAFHQGLWWAVAVIGTSSILAVVYVGRVLEIAYFREPNPQVAERAREAPLSMLIPIWVMALASVYFGFDTRFPLGTASAVSESLLAMQEMR